MYDILSKCLIYNIYKLEKQLYMQQISGTAKKYHHPEKHFGSQRRFTKQSTRYRPLLNEVPLRSEIKVIY